MKRLVALLLVTAVVFAQTARPLDVEYREAAGRLIAAAMSDSGGYEKLGYLTTRIGNRLSGSTGLERAVAGVFEQMKTDGRISAGYQVSPAIYRSMLGFFAVFIRAL